MILLFYMHEGPGKQKMAWMKGGAVGMTVLAAELWGQGYGRSGHPVDGDGDIGESGLEGIKGDRGQILKPNMCARVAHFS